MSMGPLLLGPFLLGTVIQGSFPTESPFRVDQVIEAPMLTGGLVAMQLALACAVTWAARRRNRMLWWVATGTLLGAIAVFVTLACWGTSDIAKLNFYFDPARLSGPSVRELLPFEPVWWWLAPWITRLPYRMAAFHGLLVAALALVPVLLARAWGRPAWAGWWSLLLVSSPMLRGFVQNAHSRQALAALLAIPLLLWSLQLIRWRPRLILGAAALALGVHLTALPTLLLACLPAAPALMRRLPERRAFSLGAAVLMVVAGLLLMPPLVARLQTYAGLGFFSSYPIKPEVVRNELLIVGAIAVVWIRQRLTWRGFWRQREGLALALYLVCYAGIQASLVWRWWPQVTFRLGDTVGVFLLISLLAWLRRRQALGLLVPLLLLNLLAWFDRAAWPQGLDCGLDDDFLCVPDRWPWSIQYPRR